MNQENTIQLESSSILKVPLESYYRDFTFIVNGEEFKTSRIISDILSPKISQMHSIDPTIDTFKIDTQARGDFQTILSLIDFKESSINENEITFITEILEIFCNESIKIHFKEDQEELTNENVLKKIEKHEKFQKIYSDQFGKEIEYISLHFNEILSKQEELSKLKINTLYKIINNDNLQIEDEDQLLHFINELYQKDREYSILYETVFFTNVTTSSMKEFLEIYEISDLDHGIWKQLCFRLEEEIIQKSANNQKRYTKPKGLIFSPTKEDPFSGIINHFRTQTNNNITNEIEVTASSCGDSSKEYQPQTVLLKENPNNYFYSNDTPNSWLKFDFNEHRIIPTDYTIRAYTSSQPKSWVIEVSNDDDAWETIDEVTNDSNLKGNRLSHTYSIKNIPQKEIRYLKIRLTDTDWSNYNHLVIETFEIYGTLI